MKLRQAIKIINSVESPNKIRYTTWCKAVTRICRVASVRKRNARSIISKRAAFMALARQSNLELAS